MKLTKTFPTILHPKNFKEYVCASVYPTNHPTISPQTWKTERKRAALCVANASSRCGMKSQSKSLPHIGTNSVVLVQEAALLVVQTI